MPFSDEFADVYEIGIKEACSLAGAYCERVDEQIYQERILDRIYNQIAKADLVVADMTGRNPNVFYEVGYAHALGKRTILLTKSADDIPFDLKHFPHIVYGSRLRVLRDSLEKRVKHFLLDAKNDPSGNTVAIELFVGGQNLSKGHSFHLFTEGKFPTPKITVQNASSVTFEPGAFKLGILSPSKYPHCRNSDITTTRLPDGSFLHMLPDFPKLFPSAYTEASFMLSRAAGTPRAQVGQQDQIVLRVFTSLGTRDYDLFLKCVSRTADS